MANIKNKYGKQNKIKNKEYNKIEKNMINVNLSIVIMPMCLCLIIQCHGQLIILKYFNALMVKCYGKFFFYFLFSSQNKFGLMVIIHLTV